MQRALNRAYQRLQGNHPKRPKTKLSHLAELGADVLLGAAALAVLSGVGLLIWAFADGLAAKKLIGGVVLIALGPLLLRVWERIVWDELADDLSKLT
jgi:hypothetical protein